MVDFSVLEQKLFQRILDLQSFAFQSKAILVITLIMQLVFRDLFLMIFFLTPLSFAANLVKMTVKYVEPISMALTLVIFILLLILLAAVICGTICLPPQINDLIKPIIIWIDIMALPLVTILIILAKKGQQPDYFIAFDTLSIILLLAIQVFNGFFFISKAIKTSNYLHKRQARLTAVSIFLNQILCIYLSIDAKADSSPSLSDLRLVICGIISLAICLLKAKQRLFCRYFLYDFAEKVSHFIYLLELHSIFLITAYNISHLEPLKNNIVFAILLMSNLGYKSLHNYLSKRKQDFYLSQSTEIQNINEAQVYLDLLGQLVIKSQNDEGDIILVMIKRSHSMNCTRQNCYCSNQDEPITTFITNFVKSQLKTLEEKFSQNASFLVSILFFKIQMFSDYPQILAILMRYLQNFSLYFISRYSFFPLKHYVRQFIRKKNQFIKSVDSEMVFLVDGIRAQIQKLAIEDIQIRGNKWKLMTKKHCRLVQLQKCCQDSLKKMKRILQLFHTYKASFKKSREFNILLLFYFNKVSFLNHGKEARQNLKSIFGGFKEEEVRQLKQFKKYIFHKNCCVVQSKLGIQSVGKIVNCSRNIEKFFGYDRESLIGLSVSTLMPDNMGQQHEKILQKWLKNPQWKTIGKIKDGYCVHKQKYSYLSLVYIKHYTKNNQLFIVTNIFKLNENDFLILSPQKIANNSHQDGLSSLKIIAMGKRFINILGTNALNLNFEILLQGQTKSFSQLLENKLYKRVVMNTKQHSGQIHQYLNKIQKIIDKADKKSLQMHLHQQLQNSSTQKHVIQFTVKNYIMGDRVFKILHLRQSKKYENQNNVQNEGGAGNYRLLESSRSINPDNVSYQNNTELSELEDDHEEAMLLDARGNQSMSSVSEQQNYPLVKILQERQQYLLDSDRLVDQRLTRSTICIVFLLLLLVSTNLVSQRYYGWILLEVKGIFAADGTVSDLMQTTQFGYIHMFSLRSQLLLGDYKQFDSTMQSARYIQNFVAKLRANALNNNVAQVTSLTKIKLFGYIQEPSEWITSEGQVQKIKTYQFMQKMYYTTNQIFDHLQQLKAKNSTDVDLTLFHRLRNNFHEMERLNEYFLKYYQYLSTDAHQVLDLLSTMSLLFFCLISFLLFLLCNYFCFFRYQQRIENYQIFTLIPNYFYQQMKNYYTNTLVTKVLDNNSLENIEQNQQQLIGIDTDEIFNGYDVNSSSITTRIKLINYERYLKWILSLLVFLALNIVNYWSTNQIRQYIKPSQSVILLVNDLMRSQNLIIQSYAKIKAAYYINGTVDTDLYNNVMLTMNQSELKFAQVVYDTTYVFFEYDKAFKDEFLQIVVKPVCPQAAVQLNQWQDQKCLKEMPLKILDAGILVSMSFFQRNVRQAIEFLHRQYLQNGTSTYPGDYFRKIQYTQLDKMLIYMFKIYQSTQASAYNSYIRNISFLTKNYLSVTIYLIVSLIILGLLWFKSISWQKENLSLLQCNILLIPTIIMKKNNRIISSYINIMEIKNK